MIDRFFTKSAEAWKGLFRSRQAAPAPLPPPPRLGDLAAMPSLWHHEEGFHHPDWQKITTLIEQRTADGTERENAWHHAAVQWLSQLKTELGDGYRLGESRNFLLVSAKASLAFRYFLAQCESVLVHLRAKLGQAAWRWPHGKHAVLMIEDEEVYYCYVSHFYADGGEYGTSSGICLRKGGYVHTVLAPAGNAVPALVHELTHLCLTTRRLPLWLEEGLATHLERELTGRGSHEIDKESIVRQRGAWDRESIQRFWSGESFRVGEERELSYGLAEHLVKLLSRECRDLGAFIVAVRREDAGQAAVRQHFDVDLSELAASFLGEGDWQRRPVKPPQDREESAPPP